MSIVKSSRNQDQLLLNGYVYRRAKTSQTNWRCGRNNCAGRVRFDDTQYIIVTEHNHAPNPEQMIANAFKSKISSGAVLSHDPPRRIINEALLNVDKHDGTAVPNYPSSQRTIERKRKRNDIALPSPTSFNDVNIPDELRVTNGGQRFLLYDNEACDHRLIILAADGCLDRLSNSEHWHCDGTFKLAPQLFYQLYTIHGSFCGRALPSVYCYLSGKAENLYDEMFDVVLSHVTQRPKSITIDFEKAVENVVKQKIPGANVSYCFFHFKQALWKKIKNLSLQKLFVDDHEVREYLKNFGCLTLIPEQLVISEFERLQNDCPESINDFVDYFEDSYVGRLARNNRRRAPRFSIPSWSCYARLEQQLPRTNNSSEGWHRALQHSARLHPSVYESIKDLQVEQHATIITGEKLLAGQLKLRRRIKYEQLDEQLQQLVSSFHVTARDVYFKRARALFNF